ncbi:MAG: celB [Massilibacillus sp.]|nr:celB [Massilibacillus sp.]
MGKLQDSFDKFIEYIVRFAEIKAVIALKDGFILTLPITLVGSVFLLIMCFPINGYSDFMAGVFGKGWDAPLQQVSDATFGVLALFSVLGIAYKYAESEECDGITCALLALGSFFIITKASVIAKSGEIVGGVIPRAWVGGNGMISSIVIGLVVGYIFCYFAKRGIGIKMPAGVPDGVAKAFAALLPGAVVFTLSAVVYFICDKLAGQTFTEVIFTGLQTPLQNLSDTLIGGAILSILMCVLFWAGIHGPNIVGGVMNPVLTANAIDNQHLIDAGISLLGNEQAKIITIQVTDVFIKLGGCGATLGFLIAMIIFARSAQFKQMSKLALIPGLFNINEPIIFGLPIVFNPYFIVPFIGAQLVALFITYISIAIGFMTPFGAVQVPWTTPPLISGLLLAGWQGLVVQIVIVAASVAIYLPFMKVQDKVFVKDEEDAKQAA